MDDKEFEESSGNVFQDLGFENPEEELLKAKLAYFVHQAILEKKLTQKKAAEIMGITQPDVSKLKHGEYSRFTAERLLNFLNHLSYDVDIQISKTQANHGHLTVETREDFLLRI